MTVFAGFMAFLRDSSKAVVHQPDTSTTGPASPEPVESTSITGNMELHGSRLLQRPSPAQLHSLVQLLFYSRTGPSPTKSERTSAAVLEDFANFSKQTRFRFS
ncbi:hypothetical protein RRG08_040695 [Elysia crispata]|uniref:Uncharacterized protein n=1 Tax=Elysia crispata TaxID=231223 RepID=A0AAE1E685_9GAST|nr:hypothetical protein RRG08_040695 [Elysia crispata]